MGTIIVMAEASAFMGFIYLINEFIGKKHPAWHMYVVGFLVMCGILFTYPANASYYYEDYNYEYTDEFDMLNEAQRKMCADNMLKCERMAKYHYELSKSKCWWLPNLMIERRLDIVLREPSQVFLLLHHNQK